jgi:NAD-dependent dihydropyrimidine dehydrogenase PreA subunit
MVKKSKPTVEIYKSWCKRCGICAAFCPVEALGQDEAGLAYLKDPEKCTGCRLCEMRCPDFAIHVQSPRKKEEKAGAGRGKTQEGDANESA